MTRRQTLTTGLILLTAILNGCTIGYDETMMNNLNITKRYVSGKRTAGPSGETMTC